MKNIKDIVTLTDLMLVQLKAMHDAELQWAKAMREIAGGITDNELRKALSTQAASSTEHARNLEGVLKSLGTTATISECLIVRDLINEIRGLQGSSADTEVLHAGLVVTTQSFLHYMIARYGSVSSFARQMEQELVAATLHSILDEEKANDEALTKLAEDKINKKTKTELIM